ncbi:MAG: Maf family nucleotide pyrophosphatase [Bacteroidota bacterium]
MLLDELKDFNIILASQSPRRHHLLKETGLSFSISHLHVIDEDFPINMGKFEVPVHLAEQKSKAYSESLKEKDILITADTIVWFENAVINKPNDRKEAIDFLHRLSGNMHEVVTGMCLRGKSQMLSFYSYSEVYFADLKEDEILYYVEKYKPFDKAGAYGIQEWIGYIGIHEIRGSFFNVMGLPVQLLYQKLGEFINKED